MFLCMFPLIQQSIASYVYRFNAKEDKIAIELNVNVNINGSKTKETIPGNLSLTRSYIKIDMMWNRDTTISETVYFAYRNSRRRKIEDRSTGNK